MAKQVAKLTRRRSYWRPQDRYRNAVSTCPEVSSAIAVGAKIEALRKRKSILEATIRYLEHYQSLQGPDANGQNHRNGR
jgi:hypothetical protein